MRTATATINFIFCLRFQGLSFVFLFISIFQSRHLHLRVFIFLSHFYLELFLFQLVLKFTEIMHPWNSLEFRIFNYELFFILSHAGNEIWELPSGTNYLTKLLLLSLNELQLYFMKYTYSEKRIQCLFQIYSRIYKVNYAKVDLDHFFILFLVENFCNCWYNTFLLQIVISIKKWKNNDELRRREILTIFNRKKSHKFNFFISLSWKCSVFLST